MLEYIVYNLGIDNLQQLAKPCHTHAVINPAAGLLHPCVYNTIITRVNAQ